MEMECTPDYERPIASPASDGLAFRINLSTFLYDKDVNVAPVIWDRRQYLTPPMHMIQLFELHPSGLYNGHSNSTREIRDENWTQRSFPDE